MERGVIVIRTANGTNPDLHIEVDSQDTVAVLKQLISSKHTQQPPARAQKLIYSGRMMNDEDSLKTVFNLSSSQSTQTVHLVITGETSVSKPKLEKDTIHHDPTPTGSSPAHPANVTRPPSEVQPRDTTNTTNATNAQGTLPRTARLDRARIPPPPSCEHPNSYYQWYYVYYALPAYLAATRRDGKGEESSHTAGKDYDLANHQWYPKYLEWYQQQATSGIHDSQRPNVIVNENIPEQNIQDEPANINNLPIPMAEFNDDENWDRPQPQNPVVLLLKLTLCIYLLGSNASIGRLLMLLIVGLLLFLHQTNAMNFGGNNNNPAEGNDQPQPAAAPLEEQHNNDAPVQERNNDVPDDVPVTDTQAPVNTPIVPALRPTVLQEIEIFFIDFFTSLFPMREPLADEVPAAPVF